MKTKRSTGTIGAILAMAGVAVLLLPAVAAAADPSWRPTYDIAMRWLNFIILVAVIVKYAREPIKEFLKLKKDDVVSTIDELEHEKSKVLEEIKAANQQALENQARLEELKSRLIAQGENRKQELIDQANQQSVIMLEETRRKLEHTVDKAKAKLKLELLDLAMEQALQRLPTLITESDNQRLLDDYMRSIKSIA